MDEFKVGDCVKFQDKLPRGKNERPVRRTIQGKVVRITSAFYEVIYEYKETTEGIVKTVSGKTFVPKSQASKC